jgi:hypothetical protein
MSAYLLVLLAVASRIIPHAWLNFTAVGGSLLYFGARRRMRDAVLPLVAFAGVDYYLTTHFYGYPFHLQDYLITWTWYVAVMVLGHLLLRRRHSVALVAGASVLSATSFFLVSNFAVWAGSALYPHTMAGLATCYTVGLPYYRNDLISTVLVAGLAFGLPEAARVLREHRAAPRGHAAA